MRSLEEIKRLNQKAKFARDCQNMALHKYGKRYADLDDSQCAEISKLVKEQTNQ